MKFEHIAAAVAGLALCVSVAGCGDDSNAAPAESSAKAAPEKKNDELSRLITKDVDPGAVLPKATWDNLDQLFSATAEDPELQKRFLDSAADSTEPVSQFVAALLHLTQGNTEEALTAFRKLPIEKVPANHLYAAYRLHQQLAADQANPYRPRLRKAIEQGELTPLLSARFLAHEGDVEASLKQYLKTDPANWVNHDVDNLRIMRLHAGLGSEVDRLVKGALRGGRITSDVKNRIYTVMVSQREDFDAVLKSRLSERIRNDEDTRKLVAQAAIKQLEIRRRFVREEFAELLKAHAKEDATQLSQETVLLLTLAAAREKNTTAFDLWSGELRRRNPQPEIETWIKSLRAEIG